MEPDDKEDLQWTSAGLVEDPLVNIGDSLSGVVLSYDDYNKFTDISFSVIPETNNRTVYTSYKQRELHEKYPALKKAWEDYLNMYNLTQGEPPIVE